MTFGLYANSCDQNINNSVLSDAILHVKDRAIVDFKGNPIRLRGIYTRATWLGSEEEVEWFKDWGVNFVRILLTHDDNYWDVVNDGKVDLNKRCILREENLKHMDERVNWLEKNQIYFMVEVHWRALGIDDNLVEPELLKEQFSKFYKSLAQRYKHLNYLVGYCMFSEIYVAPQYYENYKEICTAIVDAVREADPGRIVSMSGVQTSAPSSLIDEIHIERESIIYDFHFYSPKMFTHYRSYYGDLRYPGWIADGWATNIQLIDSNYLKNKLNTALKFSKKWNVPIWCGEFGAFGNAPDNSSHRWERDMYKLFEENNINWILWTWKSGRKDVPDRWKKFWKGTANISYITIVPHGGPFSKSIDIQIQHTLDEVEIRYTLDGTEPKSNSLLYEKPFKIFDEITVKAAAFKNKKIVTSIDSASFYQLPLQIPENPKKLSSGLKYYYYEGDNEQISNFENLEPVKIGVSDKFDRSMINREDKIAIKFTGYIDIP
ncbi:MAG: cellulase family glycosylhydrolase, partial [Candidatus Hodarchaeota archaeon]